MKKLFLLFAVILIAGSLSFYAQAPLPFSETFDTMDIPAGWTVDTGGGDYRWFISDTNFAGGTPNELVAGWQEFVGTAMCFTPVLDTSGTDLVELSFRQYYMDYGTGASIKVQYSHNGVDWVDTGWILYSGSGDIGPSLETFEIPSTADTLWIAWVVEGDHYQIDYWILDDIYVSAVELAGPDAAVYAEDIWFDPPAGMPGDVIEIHCRVHNIGTEPVYGFTLSAYYSLVPNVDLQLITSAPIVVTIDPGEHEDFYTTWATDAEMAPADYIITIEVTDVQQHDVNMANNIAWTELNLPVVLGHFTAFGTGNIVNISWMTMSEVDNLGFNLYRLKAQKISPFISFAPVMINEERIPGQGTSSTPHLYSFTDFVKNGIDLIYILESVSTYGETEEFSTRLQWMF